MVVDLALLAILSQEASEDTLSSHPENLGGETGLGGTLSLTDTGVTALCLCELHFAGPCSGVSDCVSHLTKRQLPV